MSVNRQSWALLLTSIALVASGCASEEPSVSSTRALQGYEATTTPHAVSTTTHGPVGLEPPTTRPRRRVDIDQLNAAIRDATGGIEWTDPTTGQNLFTALSATLGKPDYALMTSENLAPTALFHKFLNDAARQVCHKLMDRELSDPNAEKILFLHVSPTDTYATAPEKVELNLKALLLRFHGRFVKVGDPALALWRWLYESSEHVGASPAIAWRTVCTGLIRHPDFYFY